MALFFVIYFKNLLVLLFLHFHQPHIILLQMAAQSLFYHCLHFSSFQVCNLIAQFCFIIKSSNLYLNSKLFFITLPNLS